MTMSQATATESNAPELGPIERAMRSLIGALPGAIVRRADGWASIVTGLGHALVDKARSMLPAPFVDLPDRMLADMFHGDGVARKGVCKLPDDALRLGFRVTMPKDAGGHDVATAIQDAADDLKVIERFRTACYWERLFGGGAIFVAADDGQYALDSQARPLRRENLKRIHWLRTIDRTRIHASYEPNDLDEDPTSPTYGEPLIYLLDVDQQGVALRIHRTRLILFPGAVTTDEERRRRGGWGISVIDWAYDALQRNGLAWNAAAGAVGNAQYVVYKLKGLGAMFNTVGGEARAQARANTMERAKSMISAVLIDADDDYQRENPNFGNLPDMLKEFMLDTSSAFDMPGTKLWGRAPEGMNSTGEHDTENWNDSCDAYRVQHLRPRLMELVELIMLCKEGPTRGVVPDGWNVTFPPLRQLSEDERASVRLKTSQADASDIDAGILLPQEVATSRFRPEGYSTETQIDLATRELMLKMELEQRTTEMKAGRAPGMTPEQPAPNDNNAPAQAAE